MFIAYDSLSQVPAYLDPGTGSIIIMGIMGALAGVMIIVKIFLNKIKTFAKNLFCSKHDAADRDK